MSRLRMRRAGKRGAVVVVPEAGPPCPRCGRATDIRLHRTVGARELRKPFYYARWYFCANRKCRTTTIMPEEFKVLRDVPDMSGREEGVLRMGDDIVMDVLANEDSKTDEPDRQLLRAAIERDVRELSRTSVFWAKISARGGSRPGVADGEGRVVWCGTPEAFEAEVQRRLDGSPGYRMTRLQGTDGRWGPWEPF
jgi:hypothetical protein